MRGILGKMTPIHQIQCHSARFDPDPSQKSRISPFPEYPLGGGRTGDMNFGNQWFLTIVNLTLEIPF